MKFFSKIKHLKVYHAKRKSVISFVDGVYETDDQAEISLLITVDEIGYDPKELLVEDGEGSITTDENVEPPEEVILATDEELDKMSLKQLRVYAKDQKITIPGKTRSTVDVCAFIKEYQAEQEGEE